MPTFFAGQPDYIEKLNTLATAASMTNGTVAASFLSLAVTGTATAASFVGPLTGNASTATTLATARNINGVSFNGSADITVTAAAGTLTGTTLAAGVTASSLTSVGTLTALTVSGQSSFAAGSAAAPSVKVGGEQNGLFSSTANTLDVTVGGLRQARFQNVASAVNYGQLQGSATGGYIGFSAVGSDTNIGITYTAKGAGTHDYYVRNGVNFRVSASTDNAINYFTVTGQATGLGPLMLAGGSDTNVTARYRTQGTGSHQFETGSSGNIALVLAHTASAVNYPGTSGSATGAPVSFFAVGSDANIDFAVFPKGTGVLRFGTHSAIGAETVTGFITIKDAGGTTRKLAVLS